MFLLSVLNSCTMIAEAVLLIEHRCPVCSTLYQADPARLRHGRQTTCSRDCSYTLRARKLTTSTSTPCAVGQKTVTRPASHRKSKEAFCSRECHYKGRSMGIVRREVVLIASRGEPFEVARWGVVALLRVLHGFLPTTNGSQLGLSWVPYPSNGA